MDYSPEGVQRQKEVSHILEVLTEDRERMTKELADIIATGKHKAEQGGMWKLDQSYDRLMHTHAAVLNLRAQLSVMTRP